MSAARLSVQINDGQDTALGATTDPAGTATVLGQLKTIAGGGLALGAGEAHLGAVGGLLIPVAVELTRPADTTAYAANDIVSDSTSAPTLLAFANLARVNGGSGYIVRAILRTNRATDTARFRLHLFNTNAGIAAPLTDNAAYETRYADRALRAGIITFDALATGGGSSDSAGVTMDALRLPVVFAAGSRTLYGLLQTLDAFTPVSGQKFWVEPVLDGN
jgi:hypothetical protein